MQRTAHSIIAGLLVLTAAASAVATGDLPESRQPPEQQPQTLTLAQALELVDRQNPDLGQRRARIAQADATARQALAAVLPIVKATGGYTLNNQDARLVPPGGGELVLQPKDAFTANGSVQVPLFAQSAYSDIGRARELARAERAGYEADRHQLRGAVVRACWLVESAHAIVRVAEQGVTSAAEHHDSTRRAAAAGTATQLSVLQAQSDLARRRGELAEAKASVGHAELALGALLGRAVPVRVQVPALQQSSEGSAASPAAVDAALGARHEVAQRTAELSASEHAVTASTLRFLPSLSGSFVAFASDEPYVTGDQSGWRAGLELSWTLYDEARYAKRDEAIAERERVRAADKATRLAVAKEVRDAELDVDVARERLAASSDESTSADETARSAERSFAAGQASSLDVIDAHDRQTQAAVGLERARADLGVAIAALRTARGTAW
ncbi:MAG TPA: TolC family protein [Polyangiaceae bacterium]|nr:TolC family protein [Polyangiaceae bacterium]